MTTFISHSPTVFGYSFDSSFWLPGIGPRPLVPPSSGDVHILTPEYMYSHTTEHYSQNTQSFELTGDVTRTNEITGSAMFAIPGGLWSGLVENISSSYIDNSNFHLISEDLNVSVIQSRGFSIFGINLDAADIIANYDQSSGAWKLITKGDDFFDATLPASLIQSQDFIELPFWSQQINAGPGNDTILASPGRDKLVGGTGGNAIRAGSGQDVVYAGDNVEQPLQNIWSIAYGEADKDYIWAGWGSNAWLDGGSGDDVLWGGMGRNVLIGGAGNDTLVAENGTNYIMVFAEDVRASEIDTLYLFATADNYLQLPSAWQGTVGTYFDGTSTFLVMPTDAGDFYVQVWGVAPPEVWSHVYFA